MGDSEEPRPRVGTLNLIVSVYQAQQDQNTIAFIKFIELLPPQSLKKLEIANVRVRPPAALFRRSQVTLLTDELIQSTAALLTLIRLDREVSYLFSCVKFPKNRSSLLRHTQNRDVLPTRSN